MSPEYQVARQCLQLLKGAEMASIKKLRLEIQLVQLLRLLPVDDLVGTAHGSCSKEAFQALLEDVMAIRCGGGNAETINSVMERLGSILAGLSNRSCAADMDAT